MRMRLSNTAVVLAVAMAAALVTSARSRASIDAPKPREMYQFSLRKDFPLETKSTPVEWQGRKYYLVRLNSVRFRFKYGQYSDLTARFKYNITHFDTVTYELHAALFDASGTLLGTASAPVEIERTWVGFVWTSTEQELLLNFGISRNYNKVKYFAVAISDREVLTPDQWKRRKEPNQSLQRTDAADL